MCNIIVYTYQIIFFLLIQYNQILIYQAKWSCTDPENRYKLTKTNILSAFKKE